MLCILPGTNAIVSHILLLHLVVLEVTAPTASILFVESVHGLPLETNSYTMYLYMFICIAIWSSFVSHLVITRTVLHAHFHEGLLQFLIYLRGKLKRFLVPLVYWFFWLISWNFILCFAQRNCLPVFLLHFVLCLALLDLLGLLTCLLICSPAAVSHLMTVVLPM